MEFCPLKLQTSSQRLSELKTISTSQTDEISDCKYAAPGSAGEAINKGGGTARRVPTSDPQLQEKFSPNLQRHALHQPGGDVA